MGDEYSGSLFVPQRTVEQSQMVIRGESDYLMINMSDDGSLTTQSFVLAEGANLMDVWGDRVLVSEGENCKVYQLTQTNLTELASMPISIVSPCVFYDADHIVANGSIFTGDHDYTFFRINAGGGFDLLSSIPNQSLGNFILGQHVLTKNVQGSPVVDISNPDNPVLISSLTIPLQEYKSISFDGQDRYLVNSLSGSSFILDEDLEEIISFDGQTPEYVSRNTVLVGGSNIMLLAEHRESLPAVDPVLPTSLPGICKLYPNPFRDQLGISLMQEKAGRLELAVYNMRGQLVKRLYQGFAAKGDQDLIWDSLDESGHRVSSGIYLLKVHSGNRFETRRVVLIK